MSKNRKEVETFSSYDLPSNINEAIKWLQDLKEKHGPTAQIDIEVDQFDSYSDSYSAEIEISREETDEEYVERLAAEKKFKEQVAEAREASERQQYEELKKKFDK